MAQVGNWTEERSSTQGAGDIIVSGALSGAGVPLRDSLSAGLIWYSIANGNNREAGVGTFDGVDTIQRTTIGATWDAGIYNQSSPSPINLVGPSVVSCTFNSSAFRELEIANPPADGFNRITTRTSITSTLLQLLDEGNAVRINSAGATNLTIDPVSITNFPIGYQCMIVQGDVGQVSVIGSGVVTIISPLGKNKTPGTDEVLTIYHESTDIWRVMGGIA